MSNAAATAKMASWKAGLRALPAALKKLPAELAPIVESELHAAIAASRSVGGQAHAPLKNPKKATPKSDQQADVTVTPKAKSILVRLVGGMVYKEYGTGRQVPRPIMGWENGLPPKLGNAIRRGIVAPWKKLVVK